MSGRISSSQRSPWLDYAIKVPMAALLIAFVIAVLANLGHLWRFISLSSAYFGYLLNVLVVTPLSGLYAALAGAMTFWPALGGAAVLACVSIYFLCLKARHKVQPFMSQSTARLATSIPRLLIWPEIGLFMIMASDLISELNEATIAQLLSAAVMAIVLFRQIFGTSESIARRVERLSASRS